MKPAKVVFSLLIVIGFFFVFILKRWKEPLQHEAFDRHPATVYYTKHALCRMDCRHISKDEIAEIMEKGSINFNKSNRADRPCPTFALQGRTTSGENIRVIFAQCTDETKVITCYNLEEDFECHCPGDEKKNNN
ncbi:DUF4258 domain-containing protein [Flavisolibacter ginsenosidimutans]|uniref:DUF4258 domain-containing protein n=1 Tax=Flavisolibacter ginsenosidimutans TaxID=661481 RepID=A0A5B8UGL8_9BACT|nr:DUF4258 domain-containing protein [Flavisolibacter ginsenosidimutans]QEC55466.1 DUF4258 domain-containing protein [Flavisolibacter ginsenosidimutans]